MVVAEKVDQDAFEDLDGRAAEAIQQRIVGRVASRQEKQKETAPQPGWLRRVLKVGLGEATEVEAPSLTRVKSSEFRKNLENWEPWKLNEKSVQDGKNLHMRIAKAYASNDFRDWLAERSGALGVEQDELLAGILEIVRHFEWETIKYLFANGEDDMKTSLPLTVININPGEALDAVIKGWQDTRGRGDYIEEAEKAKIILGLFEPKSQDHEEEVVLGRSVLGTGSAYYKPIAISSKVVRGCFDRFIEHRVGYLAGHSAEYGIWDLGYVVAEETLHNFGYKEYELRTQWHAKEKSVDEADPKLRRMLAQEVPAHEHINDVAKRIASYCTSKYGDAFMDPLRDRIGEIGTLRSTWRNPPGAI